MWPVLLLLLLLWHCVTCAAAAISTAPIVVGHTTALTGPKAGFGNRTTVGLQMAFQEAADGGVLQRNVTLVSLDDFGDPSVALKNMQLLDTVYNVLMVAAPAGNDPFDQLLSYVVQNRIPLVGPTVGLPDTRAPFQDVVINLRPSYQDEMVAQARFLVEYLQLSRIACAFSDDQMGTEMRSALAAILGAVGVSLVSSASFVANGTAAYLAPAVDLVLRAAQKPQAVVVIAQDAQVGQFVLQYQRDPRADPNCTFVFLSVSATPTLQSVLAASQPKVFFTRVVPPTSGNFKLGIAQQFQQAAAKYNVPASYVAGQACFEGYIVGRFIIEVLKGIGLAKIYKREAFLDRLYTTQIYYLDDMLVGLFGRNFSGCESSICNCNSGMRKVYMSTLDATGGVWTDASWPVTQYPITQCQAPTNLIRRPILFGTLIPTDNPVVAHIALDVYAGVKVAFSQINAAGGLNGRQYDVIAMEYSGDPSRALVALTDRWPIVALLANVVAGGVAVPSSLPRIGTLDLLPRPTEPGYVMDDLRTLATTPLELMALAGYVVGQAQGAVHFRVRRGPTSAALLTTLTKTVNTLQAVPASSLEFDSATAALDGLDAGYVIGLGNATDMLAWLSVLQGRPTLTLLTTLSCLLQLMATGAVADNATVLGQVRFPFISGGGGVSSTFTPTLFSLGVGFVLGNVVGQVLSQSPTTFTSAYTAPADVVKAWYDVQTMKYLGTVFGPYYSTNCTGNSNLQCQCNLGARSLAVLSPLALSDTSYRYQSPTCRVVYEPLNLPPLASSSPVWPIVLGVVLGAVAVLALVAWLLLRGQRDNWAAPKDASQPFCILFTDIQASTTLWASLPNDMAQALDTHHQLIRTLIRKYHCYEVKTIGDSFMCATKSPAQALRFALALQHTFHNYNWGTTAIDDAYDSLVGADDTAVQCWNGLRVRVGIHFGHGDIRRDPVSHGYDYYGTVVNTAARIEAVCHGGQIGVSEAVRKAVGEQVAGAVWADLGPQTLRGLSEPLHLHQVLPDGLLSNRRFPPLRIERVDAREEKLEEHADELDWSSIPTSRRNRVAPSALSTSHEKWAEVHPLVQKGDTTAEELWRHYAILQTGLAALLASQVRAARQQMVRQLCERMHVPDHGAEGPHLVRTLDGLIRRVLPATVMQGLRRNSWHSKPSSVTASPLHRNGHLGASVVHRRGSRPEGPEAYLVNIAQLAHNGDSGDVSLHSP